MKIRFARSIHLVFLICILVLASCDQPTVPSEQKSSVITGQGGIAIGVDRATVPPEVRKIRATLERPGFATIQDSLLIDPSGTDSAVMMIPDIPAGPWSLSIRAYDVLNTERYAGAAQIEVLANTVTGVTVLMRPTGSGVGALIISLVWERVATPRWAMSRANPVIAQSDSGWDSGFFYVSEPFVLKWGEGYRMWYTTGVGGYQAIAYATSSDGVQWTKHGIAITWSQTDQRRAWGASSPSVLVLNGVFHMWFNGKLSIDIPHGGILHATSPDGIAWTIDLVSAVPLTSPATGIFGVNVVRVDSLLRMYYTVELTMTTGRNYSIQMAESMDGQVWQHRGIVLAGRASVPWEQGGVYTPCVIVRNRQYVMFYTAGNTSGGASIGRATSSDGIRWVHSSTAPEIDPARVSPWPVVSVGYPGVIEENGKLRMWFAGLSSGENRWQIGMAYEQ